MTNDSSLYETAAPGFVNNLRQPKGLWARLGLRTHASWPAPRPEQPFFAIGDIHGCFDLLQNILHQINGINPAAAVICAGDLVDRGEHSAAVLRYMVEQDDQRFVCLRGNHETMLLEMLDDPVVSGRRWLDSGGRQTLSSFGVSANFDSGKLDDVLNARDALRRAMGTDLEHWLRTRPTAWHSGNVTVAHGGADPAVPLDQQQDRHLIWGHGDWPRKARRDQHWLIHSASIVAEPVLRSGQIAINTDAHATGRLTAAHITLDAVTFLTTG